MSLLERDTVMVSTDEEGNAVVDLPHTRANNVEGLGRSANTYYSVGNVVYVDSNLSVALKCTQAGTTSNTELDISGKAVGDSVTDDSVVWKVIARSNVLDEGGATPNQARARIQTNIKTFLTFESLGLNPATVTIKALSEALAAQGGYAIFKAYIIQESFPNFEVPLDGFFTAYCLTGSMTMEIYNHSQNRMLVSAYIQTSNVIQPWREVASKDALSMPSPNNYINFNMTLNMQYIAPADGWLEMRFNANTSKVPTVGLITDGATGSFRYFKAPANSGWFTVMIPVAKGHPTYLSNLTECEILEQKFVYAQSEV